MTESLRANIVGTGSAAPDRVLSNADLEKMVETSNEWIVQRPGVHERRICGNGESTASLALTAAKNAIDNAGMTPNELDMILVATITPEMIFPATACFIQQGLGVEDVPSFDISAACSGFVYGLAIANTFIASGRYRNILVIGVDTLSRFTDYTDRGSCILFGDGAGAAIVQATDEPDKGLLYFELGTRGSGWDFIHLPAGGSRTPATPETVEAKQHFVKMRGRDVYKFAVQKMSYLIRAGMEHCHLTADDVDMVIPHQVNQRIIESATERAGFPMEKVYVNIDRFGNTSGASIPLAMDEARRTGRLPADGTVLFTAFGAGLTWAGAVIRL